jgi:hypothetical protein
VSNYYLNYIDNLQSISKYKFKVNSIIKKLSDKSNARFLLTKKLKLEWRNELNKLESKDVFKINYALDSQILLKKVFTNLDAKSTIKSNVNKNFNF